MGETLDFGKSYANLGESNCCPATYHTLHIHSSHSGEVNHVIHVMLVILIHQLGIDPAQIGIITPYVNQVSYRMPKF